MVPTFREKVEEIVRGLLVTTPAMSRPMPPDPIQQSASTVRRDLFGHMVALREQQDRESLPLRVEAASLEVRLSEVLAQAEGLNLQLTNVRGREFVINMNVSTAMDRILADLRESASPLITDFLVEMNTEFDRLTRLKPQHRRGAGELNLVTMIKPKLNFSDAPAIRRRVRSVRATIHRAEELKTIDRTDIELSEEFESLRAGLPVIDGELEPVIGE